MKIDKTELMQILGVKKEGLKTIEKRQQLSKRLEEKGYKFMGKVKEGRKVYYEVEQQNYSKEILNNITQYMFETKDDDRFSDYFLYRISNIHKPITKELLSEQCNVHRKTITKWDNKMLLNNIISKDGYFYIRMELFKDELPKYTLTNMYEYNSYIRNSKYAKKKREIAEKYKKEEIDYDTMIMLMDSVSTYAKEVENRFVYRVNKFQLIHNNELLKNICELIKETYNKKLLDYNIDWLSV